MHRIGLSPYFRSPKTPLGHLARTFNAMLNSPNRPIHAAGFRASSRTTENYSGSYRSEFNGGATYVEAKRRFLAEVSKATSAGDFSPETWYQLAHSSLTLFSEGYSPTIKIGAAESTFLGQIFRYTTHDSSHGNPRALFHYAIRDIADAMSKPGTGGRALDHLVCEVRDLPDVARDAIEKFEGYLEQYFQYFEAIQTLGFAFYGTNQEISLLPQLDETQLGSFAEMHARAMALRFIGTNFRIGDPTETGPIIQNTISIDISPNLRNVRLPMILVGTKLFCDIKNTLRVVSDRERKLFAHDRYDPYRGLSLGKALRGEKIEKPVHIKIVARPIIDRVLELRFSDNGEGIVVNQLLNPLVIACERDPEAMPPNLRKAVVDWKSGNPFAFNAFSLEELLESIFVHGVSTGNPSGSKGELDMKGMGLWGSAALLSRLGAQIKIGITPGGGFYESIVLPNTLDVPREEVAREAKLLWRRGYTA